MAFTRFENDVKVHQSLSDEPNVNEGISAEGLKELFDRPAEELKNALNKLQDELEDVREGFEASKSLSAGKLYDTDDSDGNIQAKLIKLKQIIDGVTQGAIPDGSIGKEKLNFSDTIPTNEQMGVLYLASKYNTLENVGEIEQTYITPSLANNNRQGHTVTLVQNIGSTNYIEDIYTLVGGNGTQYFETSYSPTNQNYVIVEFPKYIKLEKMTFSVDVSGSGRSRVQIYGSNDGITYTLLKDHTCSGNYGKFLNTVELNETKFWKYIKIRPYNTYHGNDYTDLCNDINFFGKTLSELNTANKMKITTEGNAKLTAYEEGQIIKVKTPSTYTIGTNIDSTLNINLIGEKTLPNDLEPSTNYTLVYNGTAFEKEV